ncbi:PREDICTED: pseudouridylate synthase 7 homolog-like protein, partial [Amphimedon queenslandica]
PGDFIVTEIDKNGELVTINKDCPILDPPVDNQTSNEQVSPEPPPPPVEEDTDDEEDDDDFNPLAEKQMLELSDLSRKFEEMSDAQSSILFETVDLGCYDSKKVRSRIHKSVKDNFPLLITRTIHNDE